MADTERIETDDVDLLMRLGDGNAPRNCAVCGDEAEYYVFEDDRLSKYLCEAHLDPALSELPD